MECELTLITSFQQRPHFFFKSSSMQAVQNLGMAVVTMMAGRIVDDQGYLVLEVFFLAWLCCKFGFCFTLITPSSSINLFFY